MDKKTEDKSPKQEGEQKKTTKEKGFDISSKIPDLSGITKKIDLDKILGGIKSMITPEESESLTTDPDDLLGMKITQLSSLFKEISKTHIQLSIDYSNANDLLLSLFKDIEALRASKK